MKYNLAEIWKQKFNSKYKEMTVIYTEKVSYFLLFTHTHTHTGLKQSNNFFLT